MNDEIITYLQERAADLAKEGRAELGGRLDRCWIRYRDGEPATKPRNLRDLNASALADLDALIDERIPALDIAAILDLTVMAVEERATQTNRAPLPVLFKAHRND